MKTTSVISGLLAVALTGAIGCGTFKTEEKKDDFFTSGSREADQRAGQRMAKAEQLAGSGEGAAQVEGKLALFDRLGGENGIAAIVDDFTPRALQDPRVNWQRKGVKRGGFSFRRQDSDAVAWEASAANIADLKKHLVQFLVLATGGPVHYDGKDMKAVHVGMQITNPEFDAVLGDLKASLDRLQIPNKEQKELLAIIESTRPQIVTRR